ncbi:hypothetical protein FE257_008593 [Aspergillus nanangensis]|uniref:Fatty acid desaturase domain-containing protein n=1 Tax=Aspergillus nanangensis TaxID=2582783 RepID=A0AAD4CL45_ASPNN|nr:hypothetical protein FE257_008593 [Aspergillus nanangensis]
MSSPSLSSHPFIPVDSGESASLDLPLDPYSTLPDLVVLQELLQEKSSSSEKDDTTAIEKLQALNDPTRPEFDPTAFQFWETHHLRTTLPPWVWKSLLAPYIAWAQKIARFPTDVVMVTHLLLYLTTSVPSAIWLQCYQFTWAHGLLHAIIQIWYAGGYTLMKHQHIHMNGILAPQFRLFDQLFPYALDPLCGHTWNSYFYHHVKHHHVEGNGPGDLSSTMAFDRDSIVDFAKYVGRFYFLVWLELPLYFLRVGKRVFAMKVAAWELGNYLAIVLLWKYNDARATFCVFVLPFLVLRLGLMAGNWGQHAFVDHDDPLSDFRSSITLIDVASNRFSFNDGYHTSHHLHPRRHWRGHPVALLEDKKRYENEDALVFRNIDYIMITVKLLQKDYTYLAHRMIPLGADQAKLTVEERATMLRARTRKFSKDQMESLLRRRDR